MLCDQLRDSKMIVHGIEIEDQDQNSIWKKSTHEEIINKRKEIEKNKTKKVKPEIKEVVNPLDMWKEDKKYKNYKIDTEGLPYESDKGVPISEKDKAYCVKKLKEQKELYEKYLSSK